MMVCYRFMGFHHVKNSSNFWLDWIAAAAFPESRLPFRDVRVGPVSAARTFDARCAHEVEPIRPMLWRRILQALSPWRHHIWAMLPRQWPLALSFGPIWI